LIKKNKKVTTGAKPSSQSEREAPQSTQEEVAPPSAPTESSS
jgi:hypothetical protein